MIPGRGVSVVIGMSPSLIGLAFVLSSFVENGVPLSLLWRPIFIVLVVTLVVQIAAIRAVGAVRGSVWAFVVASASLGMLVVAGTTLFMLAVFGLMRRFAGREYVMAGAIATGVSATLLGAFLWAGLLRGAFTWTALETAAIDLGAATAGPSIHLLVLDGYPRQDTLAGVGFDNQGFADELEARGFDLSANSRSNYDRTPFSLLSILSMRHLDGVAGLWSGPTPPSRGQQERLVARALIDLPLFSALERAGYRTRVLRGPIAYAPVGGAEIEADAGTANNFELDLLQRTPFAGVLEVFGFAAGQQRAQITHTLDAFAEPPSGPTFTIAHVMAPHAPSVFQADGSEAPAPPCYPSTCSIFESDPARLGWSTETYWERKLAHLTHLNALVLSAIDRLVEADPDAVIVILSDHGTRITGDPEAIFRNFTAARTPGHRMLLGSSPTPVNVLATVFDAYLGTDLPRQPDTSYFGGNDPWLAIEAVDP